MSSRGWEPQRLQGPEVCVFTDAAPSLRHPGRFELGLVFEGGVRICRCPVWITTQQSAELCGVIGALANV